MGDLIQFAIFFVGAYFIGTHIEKKHYTSLKKREAALNHVPCVTSKNLLDSTKTVERVEFVDGTAVVSADYFKIVLATLRNLFGGRMTPYETVLDRGRREAVIRLKEKVPTADMIVNLRVESSRITQGGAVDVFAYGTALYYAK